VQQNGDLRLIPSKRFEVWSRLYGRFLLEPQPAGFPQAAVSPLIVPVTQADDLLRLPEGRSENPTISGISTLTMFTVPPGERWRLYAMSAIRNSGSFTFNDFRVLDSSRGESCRLDQFTTTTARSFVPGTPIPLDETDDVQLRVDVFSSSGTLNVQVWIEVIPLN